MNPNLSLRLITTMLGVAIVATAGCTEKSQATEASLPVVKQAAKDTPASGAAPLVVPVAAKSAENEPAVASVRWPDIKEHTFARRDAFLAGLKGLEATVDRQVAELTARRAAMPSTNSAADWDFAMKEMGNARAYLKSCGEEMARATEETWAQQRDKVGLAWVRTQDAYTKVLASTTN